MFKTVVFTLLFCFVHHLSAQTFYGTRKGVGEYLSGLAITSIIKKNKVEKKLTFNISYTGKVTGSLVTTYKNASTIIADENQIQNFLVSGNYDSSKKTLLLILTHIQTGNKAIESYLTFKKPDSVYYDFSYKEEPNKIIITCTPDKYLNRSTDEFWAETSLLGGLTNYVSDKNLAHLLPMRIRFEEENENDRTIEPVSKSSPVLVDKIKKEPKEQTVKNVKKKETKLKTEWVANEKITSKNNNTEAFTPIFVSNNINELNSVKTLVRKTVIRRTITLDSCCFKIELYDNGEIDGDIATLLLDGETIISKQLLSTKSVSIDINLSKQKNKEHTLELFADNMGLIPPNTALVVLTCNKKRYEITLSSTEEINEAVYLKFN